MNLIQGKPSEFCCIHKTISGESSYTGAVGTDSFGKIMISVIQNKGVDIPHIQVLDEKPSSYITLTL